MDLLSDMLSKDPTKIWSASCAIRTSRDVEVLQLLADNLDQIMKQTSDVSLGGALRSNSTHLAFALKKLRLFREGLRCFCDLYPIDDMFNPEAESKASNIKIESTVLLENKWVDYYECSCTSCGARFKVDEREYHYTWWAWHRA